MRAQSALVVVIALSACANGQIDLFPDPLDGGKADEAGSDQAAEAMVSVERVVDADVDQASDDASGSSALDANTDGSADGPGPIEGGEAGGCSSDNDCGDSGTLHCDSRNVCVRCVLDSHCAGQAESKCNRFSEKCAAPCAKTSDCKSGNFCDTSQGACVDCLTDTQCAGKSKPKCDSHEECVQCLTRADCPTPMQCWQTTCVACIYATDCTGGIVCSASHECN